MEDILLEKVQDAALSAEVNQEIKAMLHEDREGSPLMSLEHTHPERWCEVARMLIEGCSYNSILRGPAADNKGLLRRVRAQMDSNPRVGDLKRELSIRALDGLTQTSELRRSIGEKFRDKLEGMTEEEIQGMELESWAKIHKDMTLAEKLDTETVMKLRGENIQKIEVTQKVSDEDIRELEAQLIAKVEANRAEAIDVEAEETTFPKGAEETTDVQ